PGVGEGGAIMNNSGGTLVLTRCAFTDNQAIGGSNNTGGPNLITYVGLGNGGALRNFGVATITDTTFDHNEARGGSGNTGGGADFSLVGVALGGGISNSVGTVLTARNITLRHNQAVGGNGRSPPVAAPRALDNHRRAGLRSLFSLLSRSRGQLNV